MLDVLLQRIERYLWGPPKKRDPPTEISAATWLCWYEPTEAIGDLSIHRTIAACIEDDIVSAEKIGLILDREELHVAYREALGESIRIIQEALDEDTG